MDATVAEGALQNYISIISSKFDTLDTTGTCVLKSDNEIDNR